MKGYKLTNHDMTCLNFQYELGKKYKIETKLILCYNGFHFCKEAFDCINYYNFLGKDNKETRLFEIKTGDNIQEYSKKSVCSEIEFIREIVGDEKFVLLNKGKNNIGYGNVGNNNIGNNNIGDYNIGDHNKYNYNRGNNNRGNNNVGDCNVGNNNVGIGNEGNDNYGNWNTGDYNKGKNKKGNYKGNNYLYFKFLLSIIKKSFYSWL